MEVFFQVLDENKKRRFDSCAGCQERTGWVDGWEGQAMADNKNNCLCYVSHDLNPSLGHSCV